MLYNLSCVETGEIIATGEFLSRRLAYETAATFLLQVIPPFYHVILAKSETGFDVYLLRYMKKKVTAKHIYSFEELP